MIGGIIYGEIRTANGTTTTLHYLFDENGTRIGFVVNGNDTYYYRFNLQGDVTGIYDESGTLVVQYTYDAWGKLEPMTGDQLIGLLNPIRYRGYYYDIETGFYYLQTRYYDPEIGRFINADGVIAAVNDSIQGYNQFVYCFNNPTKMDDSAGHWPKLVINVYNLIKGVKKAVNKISKSIKSLKSSYSVANHVKKAHVTTPTAMLDLGPGIGKVGFSSTLTKQNKEPGLFHSSSDTGNDKNNYAAGINIVGWLGADVGVNSKINVFVSVQLTPWIHGEVSVGLEGVGASIGFDVGDQSYDFDINAGIGLILIFVAPGQSVPAS